MFHKTMSREKKNQQTLFYMPALYLVVQIQLKSDIKVENRVVQKPLNTL